MTDSPPEPPPHPDGDTPHELTPYPIRLPEADQLRQLEEIRPGFTDEMLKMAMLEQANRQESILAFMQQRAILEMGGIIVGGLFLVGSLAAVIILAWMGQKEIAIAVIVGMFGTGGLSVIFNRRKPPTDGQ